MNKEKILYKLKGHEKFPLREGWLNKGIVSVNDNPKIFLGTIGADKLGVGNNMVKSIRYWMQAFELIDEKMKSGAKLSQLGELIYKYDLFFEDLFTLWLLHSIIAKNREKATVWYMFFNKCDIDEAKKEDFFEIIKKEIFNYIGNNRKAPDSSIKDDIEVLLKMYGKNKDINEDPEDKNTSPFTVLGLIKKEEKVYLKKQPDLRKFSVWIVLYELSNMFENEKSLSIDRIAEGENGLVHIYNLSRVTVNSYLDQLGNEGYIKVDRTAGLDVVYPKNIMKPLEVIEEYYKEHK